MRATFSLIALILISIPGLAQKPELIEVRSIWSKDPHSAFTDLIRFKDRWWCAFRVGQAHVSPDGSLQVLTSEDGKEWTPVARISSKVADLRDPKLSVTPDNKLMINAVAALHQPAKHHHQSMIWLSVDGKDWGEGIKVGDPDYWLWRVTWTDSTGYGFGYGTAGNRGIHLYRSAKEPPFRRYVDDVFTEGYPNETAIVFHQDRAYCLLRRDGDEKTAQLGQAKAPYREWQWSDLGIRIGGPELIRLPDGRFFATVRLYEPRVRTALCEVDVEKKKLNELLTLPSGGDTSYAGMVWYDGLLWISYYASHEGKTQIYLAKVKLPTIQ